MPTRWRRGHTNTNMNMKTITFYSYKGGVGRTMALINVAWRLAKRGKRIGVWDMDLEAPGMSLLADLASRDDECWQGRGLLAYLKTSPQELARISLESERQSSPAAMPSTSPPQAAEQDPSPGEVARVRGRQGGGALGPFACRIVSDEFTKSGEIIFLPCVDARRQEAGSESLELAKYVDSALQQPQETGEGEPDSRPDPARLLEVQKRFEKLRCEYLLIDSRTGLCSSAGMATLVYPQQVLVVLGLNRQNVQGTRDALRFFRSTPEGSEIDFRLLPSLVPCGEEQSKEEAFDRIAAMAAELDLDEEHLLVANGLPYHPQMATEDRPMLVAGRANFLAERYDQLTDFLIAGNSDDLLTRIKKAQELLREAKSTEDKGKRRGRATRAVREIGRLRLLPPFDRDPDFLKLYGEVCFRAGFGVDARLALLHALDLEAKQGDGKPTIKTALLFYECLREQGSNRPDRIAWLQKVRMERYRAEAGDDDWATLYTALTVELRSHPPDIDGLIGLNQEIAEELPAFRPGATNVIAEVHALHGQWDKVVEVFTEAEKALLECQERGDVDKHVVAALYEYWYQLCRAVHHYDDAEECLRKAERWWEGPSLIQNHLDLASVLVENPAHGRKAAIEYLESVLEREAEDALLQERVSARLAILYEEEDRQADALRTRMQLFHLQPWDEHDNILRMRRLQEKLGNSDFDERHEAVAQAWLDQSPRDFFATITLAELLLLRGAVAGGVQVFLDGARQSAENAELLSRAMRTYAAERWEQDEVVDKFVTAFADPVFAKSYSSRLGLSFLHRIRGRWDEALTATQDAMELAQTSHERRERVIESIRIMERLDRWPEAQALVEEESAKLREDVNWPHDAAQFYLRYAVQRKGAVRTQLLEKALAVLRELEARTGAMQLDRTLSTRYHILAERLPERGAEEARRDLDHVIATKYEIRRNVALQAVPDADRTIFLSTGSWGEALEQTKKMARYAHDTNRWREMIERQANLLFFMGTCGVKADGQSEALEKALDFLDEADIEASLTLQELRLRCLEAVGRQDEADDVLRRIWDQLKSVEIHNQNQLSTLSFIVSMALRQPDAIDMARDAVRWIDIRDINGWLAHAQSAAALYHLCFDDGGRAEELLHRLKQIGYIHTWLGEFLHDLRVIDSVHSLGLDVDAVKSRFIAKQ